MTIGRGFKIMLSEILAPPLITGVDCLAFSGCGQRRFHKLQCREDFLKTPSGHHKDHHLEESPLWNKVDPVKMATNLWIQPQILQEGEQNLCHLPFMLLIITEFSGLPVFSNQTASIFFNIVEYRDCLWYLSFLPMLSGNLPCQCRGRVFTKTWLYIVWSSRQW